MIYSMQTMMTTFFFSPDQPISNEMFVYWTYVEMPNRQAKYVEQLLLDTFDVPMNRWEKRGTLRLCSYWSQEEVD